MLNTSKQMMQYQFNLNKQLADENRNWQERMANSAHQREIADLKAAGLNPVLSVTGGSGANTPSGSTASVSDGAGYASALANLEAARINSATQMFMHTTPSANSIPGLINYYADEMGIDIDSLLKNIGNLITGRDSPKNSASLFGKFNDKFRNKDKVNDSMSKQFSDLAKRINKAEDNGNYKKAKRLRESFYRLAYFYPDAYESFSGDSLSVLNRKNDYYGKTWRMYKRQK